MIKEAYCSFKVSELLREKGFSEDCLAHYDEDGRIYYIQLNNKDSRLVAAPTHQMAMAWLREKWGIHIQALCYVADADIKAFGVTYNVVISNLDDYCLAFDTSIEDVEYNSYEEAIEAGLNYTLNYLI